jgi:putative autoinducer-2 (AI-2) aldolase
MGRNIFQAQNPIAMCRAIAKVVHDGFSDKEAFAYYNELLGEART